MRITRYEGETVAKPINNDILRGVCRAEAGTKPWKLHGGVNHLHVAAIVYINLYPYQ